LSANFVFVVTVMLDFVRFKDSDNYKH